MPSLSTIFLSFSRHSQPKHSQQLRNNMDVTAILWHAYEILVASNVCRFDGVACCSMPKIQKNKNKNANNYSAFSHSLSLTLYLGQFIFACAHISNVIRKSCLPLRFSFTLLSRRLIILIISARAHTHTQTHTSKIILIILVVLLRLVFQYYYYYYYLFLLLLKVPPHL